MTPSQVQASFAAGASGSSTNNSPSIATSVSGTNLTISWAASATGFILEGTPSLGASATWAAVSGVTNNAGQMQVTIPLQGRMQFFRLRKP